ncbi:MAG TPA: hypothetical protein VFO39_01565 [Candidatus Sulfotelmatobacter sp.]|nr:hypothetical protein [Candidatus Sulfotelmatobacter sp.]
MPKLHISWQRLGRSLVLIQLAIAIAVPSSAKEQTVEELKARLSSTEVPDRPRLCLEIAEKQLASASKLFSDAEPDKAQEALTDVVAFSELARDYSVQSRKHEKQTEIAVRTMIRKLGDLKHMIAHEDQVAVQNAIDRLQRVRDDLLQAMFPHAKPK